MVFGTYMKFLLNKTIPFMYDESAVLIENRRILRIWRDLHWVTKISQDMR